MTTRIIVGDCRERLSEIESGSIHCCVTSPPYFQLRDYGHEAQIGLEPTPDEFVARIVEVFREVRRVLRDDGTLWLNIGDTNGSKKQLLGIPWRLAFALQADGWTLRQEIIWAKPNPMPESVKDRCTNAHEQIFLLAKSPIYYFDGAAIEEDAIYNTQSGRTGRPKGAFSGQRAGNTDKKIQQPFRAIRDKRKKRSVWTVPTQSFAEAHFATYPPELIEPCILAGCPEGGVVLDPFGGAGTTGLVADRLGRHAILIELNEEYAEIARRRIAAEAGMFGDVVTT
jgi:DNA modification methylase